MTIWNRVAVCTLAARALLLTTTQTIFAMAVALACVALPTSAQAGVPIDIPASAYINGVNVAMGSGHAAAWGTDSLLNGPPYTPRPNAAEWRVTVPTAGRYEFWIRFAAAEPRPVVILLNGQLVSSDALDMATGCWTPDCRKWVSIGVVELNAGDNIVRIQRDNYFPHLNALRFVPLQ